MPVEEVSLPDAIESVDWLTNFLGLAWVRTALQKREARLASFPYWRPERVEANPLIDFLALYETHRSNLTESTFRTSRVLGTLLTHASNVRKIYPQISGPIRESLRSLLTQDEYAAGYLYQCSIASHYIRDGYDVEAFSIGGADEGDVVIGHGNARVELQCKVIEEGAGRKIPKPTFNLLALRTLNRLHSFDGFALIDVRCSDRLEVRDIDLIVSHMPDLLAESSPVDHHLKTYVLRVEPRLSPFKDEEVAALLKRDPNEPFRPWHLAFRGDLDGMRRKPITLVLMARSAKRDHVTRGVLKRARKAAGQLTGRDPGVVFVHIPEVLPSEVMAESGKFVSWLNSLLRHPNSMRVNAVVFTNETIELHGGYDAHPLLNPKAARPLPEGFRVVGLRE